MTVYIGIDPGLDGALAVVVGANYGTPEQIAAGELVVRLFDTPTLKVGKQRTYLEAEMAAEVRQIDAVVGSGRLVHAAIEMQQARPQQGSTSALKIGVGWALWRGMLAYAQIPYEHAQPAKWKRDMGIPTGSDKDASREIAQRLFPAVAGKLDLKKHNGRADALLLAEWCRRRHEGMDR